VYNSTAKSPFIKMLENQYGGELKVKAKHHHDVLINDLGSVAECKRARLQAKFEQQLARPVGSQAKIKKEVP